MTEEELAVEKVKSLSDNLEKYEKEIGMIMTAPGVKQAIASFIPIGFMRSGGDLTHYSLEAICLGVQLALTHRDAKQLWVDLGLDKK